LGGALGVNFLSIFLAERGAEFSQQLTTTQASQPATIEMLQQLQDMMFGQHLGFLREMEMSYGFLSQMIMSQAMTMAFQEGFLLVAAVFFISIIPTLYMRVDRR
ncbi:MAG: hypothetical protein WD558_05045, partial [Pseudomonadales bacterium]